LHSFDYSDGGSPYDPLVQGSDGNFYGTTQRGGTDGYGVVFKITPAGAYTVLHNFNVSDGAYPWGGPLIQANDGFLYGTTEADGSGSGGVLFKISLAGVFTVVHNMSEATDGGNPFAGVIQASDGNFYGVNGNGGAHNNGTIFKMTTKDVVSAPYSFNLTQGGFPEVTPFQHTNGILYGDTEDGGTGNVSPCKTGVCGVFYSFNASLPAFVRALPNVGRVGYKIGILGQGFSSSSVVKFNGVKATSITLTGTTFIEATVPAGASDGYVTVTTGTTTLKSLKKFTVHNSWGTGTAMPTPVRNAATGVLNGRVYVVGGSTTGTSGSTSPRNQVYNPVSNVWSSAADYPTNISGAAAAEVNNILYLFGGTTTGSDVTSAVYSYNPTTNAWTSEAAMPTPRQDAAAVVESGLIYVIGGVDAGNTRYSTVEAYDPASNTWSTKAPMLVGKSEVSAALLGTTLVATGGYNGTAVTGDTEGYNSGTNAWSTLTSDPTARNASCAGVLSGSLFVAGGGNGSAALTANESFSLTTNKWTTTYAPLPQATFEAGSGVAFGQLFCFGGEDAFQGTVLSNVQIYQP
jgi:uncharacterized repeat protein (TIGR03803 family)